MIPAIEYKTDEIVPKDVVFLVDTSGSQSGAPLQQCQVLLRQFIHGLNPADTFSIAKAQIRSGSIPCDRKNSANWATRCSA